MKTKVISEAAIRIGMTDPGGILPKVDTSSFSKGLDRTERDLSQFAVGASNCIDVYEIGSQVKIGPRGTEFEAEIIAVNVTAKGVEYQVAYWDLRVRKTEWIGESELRDSDCERLKIGFMTP